MTDDPAQVGDPRIQIPIRTDRAEPKIDASVPMAGNISAIGDTVAIVKSADLAQAFAAAPLREPVVGETVVLGRFANPRGGIKYFGIPVIAVRPDVGDYPFDIYNLRTGRWYHGDNETECVTTLQPYGWKKVYYNPAFPSDPICDIRLVTSGQTPGYVQAWFVYSPAEGASYPITILTVRDKLYFRIGADEVFVVDNPTGVYPDANGVHAATVEYLPPFSVAPLVAATFTGVTYSGATGFTASAGHLTLGAPSLSSPEISLRSNSLYFGGGTIHFQGDFTDPVLASGIAGTMIFDKTGSVSFMGNYGLTVMVDGSVVGEATFASTGALPKTATFDVTFPSPIQNPVVRIDGWVSNATFSPAGTVIAGLTSAAWKT